MTRVIGERERTPYHPITVSAANNHHERSEQSPSSVPADSADQRLALVVGPPQQFGELIVVDDELRRADRADNRLAAVAASLAPLQHTADGVAIPLAEVLENG